MIIKPEGIDFFTGLEGDEPPITSEEFSGYSKQAYEQNSKMVGVFDAECELICIAPVEIAHWISKVMNEREDAQTRHLTRKSNRIVG